MRSFQGENLEKSPHFFSILKQCVLAIAILHRAGVCHRDIKPQNFMITFVNGLPVVKLIDFGLSEFLKKINQSMMVGSPPWMAPEVITRGMKNLITEKSDIWSLGMMLEEFYMGRPSLYYPNDLNRTIKELTYLQAPPISQKMKDDTSKFGIWYRTFVTVCTQPDPKLRPNADILYQSLDQSLE
jgi:serine/threonine protein kinase